MNDPVLYLVFPFLPLSVCPHSLFFRLYLYYFLLYFFRFDTLSIPLCLSHNLRHLLVLEARKKVTFDVFTAMHSVVCVFAVLSKQA